MKFDNLYLEFYYKDAKVVGKVLSYDTHTDTMIFTYQHKIFKCSTSNPIKTAVHTTLSRGYETTLACSCTKDITELGPLGSLLYV